MLDLIIGPPYEDVYSIGRVLLADRSKHQVLFLVNFSKNLASFKHSRFIQTLDCGHPGSSEKDDYLTTIFLSHVASVTSVRTNKVPARRNWI
jgi:hypothetical protein